MKSVFRYFLYLFLFVVITIHVQAQAKSDSVKVLKSVTDYIMYYDTAFSITLNTNSEIDYYTVGGNDFFYDIRPNISVSNKLSFSYRFISFGIGFTPKFYPGNNDDNLQGHTKAFSLGFNLSKKHFLQEIKYSKVKGFYLHNTDDTDSNWVKGKDPYIQFPDLEVKTIRGVTGYKFNPNFSINAISSQSEKQLKSCGSVISFLRYDYYNIDNKTNQRSNNFTTTLTLGYMYSLVLGSKFYITAGGFPGGGINYYKVFTKMNGQETESSNTRGAFRLSGKSGVGFDNDRLFAGADFSFTHESHKQKDSSVTSQLNRAYFQFFFGYRFNAPRFLKKETDKVEKVLEKVKP